jgi:hypothetical protein
MGSRDGAHMEIYDLVFFCRAATYKTGSVPSSAVPTPKDSASSGIRRRMCTHVRADKSTSDFQSDV